MFWYVYEKLLVYMGWKNGYVSYNTDKRYQTILSSTDFQTYKGKPQTITLKTLTDYKNDENNNYFVMSSIGQSCLGKPDPENGNNEGMHDVIKTTYSYSKQAHVTCTGADIDQQCPKCRAYLRPYAQDHTVTPGNEPNYDIGCLD